MIKLLTVVGARPQIIKAAAISRTIANYFADRIEEKILHTGQHYDYNMSQVFFDELGIPKSDYKLDVGSGLHGEQTAKMITGIEKVLLSEHFDGVILYGDTNSTLAGAVAASKLHIPIFHIEAGLRSYNMNMPEEINRIVCDQLSSILFAPTRTAIENLIKEGYAVSPSIFGENRKREICNSGDVMYDNSMHYAKITDKNSNVIDRLGLIPLKYILVTIHRDSNTDNKVRLSTIFSALLHIIEKKQTRIILPLHPRTSKMLRENLSDELFERVFRSNNLLILPPLSFLDMICLEKNAQLIMTDSGGVQKEAFFFEKPCVILRAETEWVEIISNKAGIIADANYNMIINAYDKLINSKIVFPQLFGNGKASNVILSRIEHFYNGKG